MDRKAVLEVRKLFDKNDCRIDRMRGCYVNGEKQIIADLQDQFYSFEDEELFQYCELFKKAVSGRIGRTLFNIEFPLAAEKEGGAQEKLYRLLKSELKDEALLQEFFQDIIQHYAFTGNYLILLVHGVYDIPGRTKDRVGLSDGSEYVYPFIELSICPVELLREGLCYDAEAKSFLSRMENWSVKKPDIGLLYPAFNERNTDLHAALWYARSEKTRHEELADVLLGTELPRAESAEKDAFREIVERSLGEDCNFTLVQSLQEAVNRFAEEAGDSEVTEPPVLSKGEFKRLLDECGAEEEALSRLDEVYEEVLGESKEALLVENLSAPKTLTVETDSLQLKLQSDASELLSTRVIDGREYFLIPVSEDVTVNGIRLRTKTAAADE